ncbi:hypothetical protein LTR24_007240 [Lithohypha guttulata]|uniref:Amino acid permease n=1 Tax=Lithohypha guttulata TaxID=1690604 RepID=A0ABR0K4L2_9EURO|nr:hypothetical protein LTR24_007240 [Lithohypha guttulata]
MSAGEGFGKHSDNDDLNQFGYEAQLERRFGLWSMVGLSCTIMVTWEAWFTTFNIAVIDGGRTGAFWGYVFVWVGYTCVIGSLSELVSMTPTAAGQYHWAYELAPPKYRKFISWFTGWQIVLAWQADFAAVLYLSGILIQAVAALNWPGYSPQPYQATLILWVVILASVLFNTTLAKHLRWIEGSILICHCLGFIVVLVPIVYFGPHVPAKDVWAQFVSSGGYSNGSAFFVGLVATVFPFLGADGAIHMAEEVKDARVNVPWALMISVTINGVLGIGMVIAILFTLGTLEDIEQITSASVSGSSLVDYFWFVLDDRGFATGLTSLLIAMFIFAAVAVLASTSRVTWAFARDNGLPGSTWIKKVHPGTHLPLWSIAFSAVISLFLSLINIGSSVAFNAIVSLTVACFFGSYGIPIALLAWRRATNRPLKLGPWNWGRYGLAINIVSVCWLIITWVFAFFPIAIPVTPATMNWSCVLWGGSMILGLGWYFIRQHKVFTGPRVQAGTMNLH